MVLFTTAPSVSLAYGSGDGGATTLARATGSRNALEMTMDRKVVVYNRRAG